MTLVLKDEPYAVAECKRINVDTIESADIISILKTQRGFTMICKENSVPEEAEKISGGWALFEPMLVPEINIKSIIYVIAGKLSMEDINVNVLNEWDRNFILVKREDVKKAIDIMVNSGISIAE